MNKWKIQIATALKDSQAQISIFSLEIQMKRPNVPDPDVTDSNIRSSDIL